MKTKRDPSTPSNLSESTKFKLKTVSLGTVSQTEADEGLSRLTRGFSELGPYDIFELGSNQPFKPWLY